MGARNIKYSQWPKERLLMRNARRLIRPEVGQFCYVFLSSLLILVIACVCPAASQTGPLPPSQIVLGPVVRGQSFSFLKPPLQGTSVPSITNGFEADTFLGGLNTPTTRSFPYSTSSPAAVVLTTAPTQFWRFYAPNDPMAPSNQAGSFIVGSNEVRGLTPAQIRDVLALPYTPTMQTIVEVPAGTCLLIGTAGPILNSATAKPLGVWGHGGGVQDYVIGKQQSRPCLHRRRRGAITGRHL